MTSISDALTAGISKGRELQEQIMTDTVKLEACTGEQRDELGTITKVWETVYGGRDGANGLVQADADKPAVVDSSGRVAIVQEYIGKLPYTVSLTRGLDHRLTVVNSADPANIGVYTILADETQGWATCRRLRMVRST